MRTRKSTMFIRKTILRISILAMPLSSSTCGSDEEKQGEADTEMPCLALGEACGSGPGRCCSTVESDVDCQEGACAICVSTGDPCEGFGRDSNCCDYNHCNDGVCCSTGSCESDSDCCGVQVCAAHLNGGCCIPAGYDTDYEPSCCSGRAKDRRCGDLENGPGYYCGSECL